MKISTFLMGVLTFATVSLGNEAWGDTLVLSIGKDYRGSGKALERLLKINSEDLVHRIHLARATSELLIEAISDLDAVVEKRSLDKILYVTDQGFSPMAAPSSFLRPLNVYISEEVIFFSTTCDFMRVSVFAENARVVHQAFPGRLITFYGYADSIAPGSFVLPNVLMELHGKKTLIARRQLAEERRSHYQQLGVASSIFAVGLHFSVNSADLSAKALGLGVMGLAGVTFLLNSSILDRKKRERGELVKICSQLDGWRQDLTVDKISGDTLAVEVFHCPMGSSINTKGPKK